jgi:hypothetical protein
MNEEELTKALDTVRDAVESRSLSPQDQANSIAFVQARAIIRISSHLHMVAIEMACLKESLFNMDQKLQILINVIDHVE